MVQPGQEIRGRVMKPTILTCAVTGSFPTRAQNPALPVTPQEIAEACIGAAKAGAAICHIHVREPDSGRPSMKLEYYREVVERIRSSDTDLIINLTAGPGGRFIPSDDEPAKAAPGTVLTTPEIRTAHIVELRPEICTLDLNTQWFGGGSVINSPRSIKAMAERMYAAGSKPELEIFNTGDIMLAHDLVADDTLKMPALFQIVTGIKYGLASPPEVMCLVKSMLPQPCEWAASVPDGIPLPCWRRPSSLVATAASAWRIRCTSPGANRHPANAVLVEKSVRIIEDLGGKI